jgi:hypothetical protein
VDEVVGEELGERFGELGGCDVVFVEQDAVEEDLVVEAADFGPGKVIGGMAAGGEVQRLVEHDLGLLPVGTGRFEGDVDLIDLSPQPILLFFEEVEGDGVGVVEVHELALLVAQRLEPAGLAGVFAARVLAGVFEGRSQFCPDRLDPVGLELDSGVLAGDALLDGFGQDVRLGAAVSALPPGAEKVEVLPLSVGEDHARVAAGAVDGAFEVVVVYTLAFAGEVVCPEDILDATERLGIDERLVGTVVFDPSVGDLPEVVALVQKCAEV